MKTDTKTGLHFNDHTDYSVVRLDGRVVGHIRKLSYGKGWHYAPKGSPGVGATMLTRDAVKRSLATNEAFA
jgi:hypothetical protein